MPALSGQKAFRPHDIHHRSVLQAVTNVADRYERNEMKPGSDGWVNRPSMRRELYIDIQHEWAEISGQHVDFFPTNIDAVCQLWTSSRKTGGFGLKPNEQAQLC